MTELERVREQIRVESQAMLHEQDRMAITGPTCGYKVIDRHGNTLYHCTRPPHQDNHHVAHSTLGYVLKRW